MKNPGSISRWLSLFLTGVLLVASVAVKGVSARTLPVEKTPTEKKAAETPKATVQAMSPMATVSVADFSFTQEFYLLPPAVFSFELPRAETVRAGSSSFLHTYLEVLFEHFISPNAP